MQAACGGSPSLPPSLSLSLLTFYPALVSSGRGFFQSGGKAEGLQAPRSLEGMVFLPRPWQQQQEEEGGRSRQGQAGGVTAPFLATSARATLTTHPTEQSNKG